MAGDVPSSQPGVLYPGPDGHAQFVHALAPVEAAYVPGAQPEHVVAALVPTYVPTRQAVHSVRPLVSAMLPGVHAVHVSGVADVHDSDVAVLSHVYVADATLPMYPALHFHVIMCGSPFDVPVVPTCSAFAFGASMAVHAEHVMSAGVHAPVVVPQLADVGATP